jgi:hypothetical protein
MALKKDYFLCFVFRMPEIDGFSGAEIRLFVRAVNTKKTEREK